MKRTLLPLLVTVLLPGCAWFGGDDRQEATGPHVVVVIANVGNHTVNTTLQMLTGGAVVHTEWFDIEPGDTVERVVEYEDNETKTLRLTYAFDADGRAASGTQEMAIEPETCQGAYRLTFEVSPADELTFAGGHGECELDAA